MDELEIDRELLVAAFMAEAEEILGRMERSLVALEQAPGDAELLAALFRDAHTLKGGAGMVAFDGVRDLAHDLEGLLDRLRARTLEVSAGLVSLLLESVDVLRSALSDAAGGEPGTSAAIAAFRRRLADAGAAAGAAADSPQAPAAPADPAAAPAQAQIRTLRVEVGKLDRMMNLSGELTTAWGRITDLLERASGPGVEAALAAQRDTERLQLDLQELIMAARMVPLGPVFRQHGRTVRDLARRRGKLARLALEGEGAEVDTAVVEHVRDPLLHMIHNAVDHGIETPEVRRARGKDPQGTVTLRAAREAGSMVIQVVDDGAGLDRRRIAELAAARGLCDDTEQVTEEEAARLVFEPGLTTAAKVTETSGRGVGLDVVLRNVEALRGSVTIESAEGQGTSVTLRVPLTLAVIQGFRVGVGGETYVLPLDAVVECLELPAEETATFAPWGVAGLRGKPLPYLRLRHHLGVEAPRPRRENVVVVRHGPHTAGLAVDTLHGEGSTVVKPLGAPLQAVPGVSGSSILGNGRVALILDVAGLLRETLRRAAARGAA